MIPILYENSETAFTSNGLGRLRDCISCIVTEERNGIYECDFEYPMDGAHFDLIQIGRIVGVTHDDSGDVQPFDIVGYSKPINGVVTFHAVHISYRLSGQTVWSSSINSLASALSLFASVSGTPFSYWTNKTSTGYMSSADGLPKSVRSMLGGIEGSVLDAYGGEYEWDKWQVNLHEARGVQRDFSIRYGVNMLEYEEEYDCEECFSSCVPFWTDGESKVIGSVVSSGQPLPTGRYNCVPLDLSDKFENKPTTAQLEAKAASYMNSNDTYLPTQNIHIEFIRLQDMPEYADIGVLMECRLCDTIRVIFPDFNSSGYFKIVKTEWNVLMNRYESMELGDLSTSLAEALGIEAGTETSNGGIYVKKSGDTMTGALDVQSTITASGHIYADGHVSQIGFRNSGSGTKNNHPNNSNTSVYGPINCGAGTWLLIGSINFPSGTTGIRQVMWYQDSTALNESRSNGNAVSGGTRLVSAVTVEISQATSFYLYGYQNNGSAMNIDYYWQAVRIS